MLGRCDMTMTHYHIIFNFYRLSQNFVTDVVDVMCHIVATMSEYTPPYFPICVTYAAITDALPSLNPKIKYRHHLQ